MNILYVASEVAPFAVSGGLGDVMGALPKTIKTRLSEDDRVAVILPLYSSIPSVWREKMEMVDEFGFMYGWRRSYCGIHKISLEGVDYYFVDNEQYFMRNSLYGQMDDGERFAYFCRAVIEFLLRTDVQYDILHANDWQTALTVVYARTRFANEEKIKGIKTVYTIHNIEYQGKYDSYILGDIFDLDVQYLSLLEFDGCVNLMKGAIECCDLVTTVSPNYAEELKEAYFAFGLNDIIKKNEGKLVGIVNGIDTAVFSPLADTDIVFPFKITSVKSGKAKNKKALQEELGLELSPHTPLIVMITRLTAGKGVDLLLHIFDEMMQQDVQFVLLGTGDAKYEQIFSEVCAHYPKKAKALIKFDRALSKRMYASADLFLMPSKSEPCGLAQMMACSYGTLPVVHRVGGLADTIVPYPAEESNGFGFDHFNAHELLFTVKDAILLYQNNAEWQKMVKRAMKTDFTWKKSATVYLDTYKNITKSL